MMRDLRAKVAIHDRKRSMRVDIVTARRCLEYFSGLSNTIALNGRLVDLLKGNFGYTRREPLGVIGAIGAWIYPIQGSVWKSTPALACGNSIIFKPAEDTPSTALKLAEIYLEAGLPPGCFNVVLGAAQTGQLHCQHKDIAEAT
ncbi:hypothetical protein Zmor_004215 [Zophobas morio]|uniref:Aldehyde dehydrogenase domain-containing protein n=1 Tax=Zophobas morio TaxID=2755281 RepID=A0AA38HKR3_9CUCU|nr:hypothetical protein Zmor_004215 [Zophobas morio]